MSDKFSKQEKSGAEATLNQVMKFAREDAKWTHRTSYADIFADVFAEEQGQALDVTFIRWNAGEEAPFPDALPYEEVLIILSGTYTVRTQDGEITASAGEVIYLREGTAGVYYSDTDAEIVAVTFPPYRAALRKAGRGYEVDELDPQSEVHSDRGE